MRRGSPLLLSAALALTLSVVPGISPLVASAANSPEGAVNAVLDAIVHKQWKQLGPLVCPDQRQALVQQFDLTQAFGGQGVDATRLVGSMALSLSGRDVHQVSVDGDTAIVHVAGTLTMTVDEQAARDWSVASLYAAGQPTDTESVDQFMGFLLASLKEGTPIDVDAEVDHGADGQWLLCDDLSGEGTGASFDPGASVPPVTDPLCDLLTLDELNALSPLIFATATPTTDGCTYDSDVDTSGSFYSISVYLQDGQLSFLKEVWTDGTDVQIAGKDAWATTTATWVDLGDRVLAIQPVLLGTDSGDKVDVIKLAGAIGAIVVPRLPF